MIIYYRETTFQQRRYLFELVEQLENISEACRRAKVSRKTYYRWKPKYERDGIEGLRVKIVDWRYSHTKIGVTTKRWMPMS